MSLRQPRPIRCTNTATVELLGGFPAETWLCESCAEAMLAESEKRAREAQKDQ